MGSVSKIDEASSHLPPNSASPRSASEVKSLLKKYNLRPSKGLGQNFLVDKGAVRKIIRAADLKSKDIVLEIGPGIGNLTIELAEKVRKVIGVEKDPSLTRILNNELRVKNVKNIEVIHGDILKIENCKLFKNLKLEAKNSYKIVANLPFYLTAPVIRKFLETAEVRPSEMTLVVQKEVAQRICAKVPDMNLLAISVQLYAQPKIISYISKKSFWPQPEVNAAIIKITINNKQLAINRDLFFKIVKAGFSQPRKQLINNLSKGLKIDKMKVGSWLRENNIQPSQRAETLTIQNWINLAKNFN